MSKSVLKMALDDFEKMSRKDKQAKKVSVAKKAKKKLDTKPKKTASKKKTVTKCSQDPESFYKALRFQPSSRQAKKTQANKMWSHLLKDKRAKESKPATTSKVSKNKSVFSSKDFSAFLKD